MVKQKKYLTSIVSASPWEDLRELLQNLDAVELLSQCKNIPELVKSLSFGLLDIVFVDVEELDLESEQNTETLGAGFEPYLVFIADKPDHEKMRAAMRAGGRDFLVRPFEGKDINKILRLASDYRRARVSAICGPEARQAARIAPANFRIFSFFSTKDGVGKSTIVSNFAISLANISGKRVCIVDLVLQFGDIALMLNLKPNATMGNLTSVPPEQIDENIESYLTPVQKNVFLLAASPHPEDGELLSPEHVSEALRALATRFDYVVVDTPGSFGEISLTALDASTNIFFVVEPVILSVKSLISAINVMEGPLHYKPGKLKVVLNRSNSGTGIDEEDIGKTIGRKISYSIPSDFKLVVSSINRGIPAVLCDPKSKFSLSVIQMAQSEAGPVEPSKNGNGKFSLLHPFRRGVTAKS